MKRCLPIILVTMVFVFSGSYAFAGGFRINIQSTSAAAEADAMVAHYEDASTVFYNPAAMTEAKTSQLLLDYVTITPLTEFENEEETKAKTHIFQIPHLHFLYRFNDKVAAGIATLFPFGLGKEWPEDWEGRYLLTKVNVSAYTINPNLAIKVLPNLSLGAGFSYMKSDVELRQKVNSSALLQPYGLTADDIDARHKVKGDGWGYNLGAFLDITGDVQLGITYRSQIKVDYKGDVAFDVPANASLLSPFFADQDVKTGINFPAITVIGINWTVSDRLAVELDADWTGWSSFKSLVIRYEDGTKTTTSENYHDAWTFHLGGRYRATDALLVRAGYYYDTTPVPSKSVDPLVPDARKHAVGLGIRYSFSQIALNLGYQWTIFEDRSTDSNRNGFNGKYKSTIHVAGASAEYNF